MVEGEPPLLKHNMMRVMYLIIEEPAPTLTEPGNWSENFNDWLGKCLIKEQSGRWNATASITHPFISSAALDSRPLQQLILEGVEQTDYAPNRSGEHGKKG